MASSGEIVVIYSNDVIMFRDITPELDAVFDNRQDGVLVGNRIIDWDGGWNVIHIRVIRLSYPIWKAGSYLVEELCGIN